MDGGIFWATLGAIGGAVAALLLVLAVVLVRRRSRSRSDLAAMLGAAQREVDDLRLRLDIANARLEGHTGARRQTSATATTSAPEYLITDAGTAAVLFDPDRMPEQHATGEQIDVPDRLVLTATFGAPLVKVAAFGHGIRRALSAESRNRIRFEMRREVRASRKRRRRQLKDFTRDMRAAERAGEGA